MAALSFPLSNAVGDGYRTNAGFLRLVTESERLTPSFLQPTEELEDRAVGGSSGLSVVPTRVRLARRKVSAPVRRRRLLLAVTTLCFIGLALPLGGAGGTSHTAGSALAGNGRIGSYTVQPGDSLWSIAERVDPTSDPRPLVAELASQIGSNTVQPGERLTLP